MEQRELGQSGLKVSVIGLGGMPMSIVGRPTESEAIDVIHASLEAGVTFIDTADVYCLDHRDIGHNERLIQKALRQWGSAHEVVVATKGGLERPQGDWTTNGRPAHLRRACEASLRALGVEAIGLYQLHAPCDVHPFEDSVGALARLQEEGKIQHIGLSNVDVEQITQAQALAPIVSVQNRCNPHDTQAFSDGVLSRCEADGMTFLPYSPVGGFDKEDIGQDSTLGEVARRHDASPYEVALAWLIASSKVMLPIPGASKVASARSSAKAGSLRLTALDMATLDGAYL
uniref:Predicted oxidoreductase n=1 Tax=uncultured bacterium HF186_25m_13D19 TaxID=662888 RepID=C7FPG1_9BACT|nr:predicted oxidoreductase [uncultured bacterium HF186_25m_13D19]